VTFVDAAEAYRTSEDLVGHALEGGVIGDGCYDRRGHRLSAAGLFAAKALVGRQ
jgi:hypothetical protein